MVGLRAIVIKLRMMMILQTCVRPVHDPLPHFHSPAINASDPSSSDAVSEKFDSHSTINKNLCPICLDPLSYKIGGGSGPGPGQAIFTAQCSHSFHFTCISSNVRHGNVNCPVCRSQWSQLPRNLNIKTDPILRIIDDSIATVRVQRRSFLRSTPRYNDDDPIEPNRYPDPPRLLFTVIPFPEEISSCYLSVKLNHLPAAIDLVLVANPNGNGPTHLRRIKQCMALTVYSLRPIDRVAIVTCSSASAAAARVFPLRRMTSYGKQTAIQVINRLFYTEQSDPIEGLRKGIKIIGDRAYKNPKCSILHLSNSPTRTYQCTENDPVPIHRFHVGYGQGSSNGFKEFLSRVVGGGIMEVRLRIGDGGRMVEIGEMRSGDERRIPLKFEESRNVSVDYSYRVCNEGEADECYITGEVMLDGIDGCHPLGRSNGCESLGYYYDPYRTRRWAKHLHGYRL